MHRLNSLKALWLILLFTATSILKAQQGCGTGAMQELWKLQPGWQQAANDITKKWVTFKNGSATTKPQETEYILPVVFHIIHKNGAENIPDSEVLNAFQQLNDAFANRGVFDRGSGVDTKIQFCLAQQDPDGRATTGITRTEAPLLKIIPELDDEMLKSLINWDPTRYINIWVVKEVDMLIEFNRCGYPDLEDAGYATLPPAHGGPLDGIVAEAAFLASVLPHEMGHYLGLLHTFEGFCKNDNCIIDGDQVCDTPPDATVSITGGCNTRENSCSTDTLSGFTTDQPDLKTNFMDYGNHACRHDFTQGQKERMRFMIEHIRTSLLNTGVCTAACALPASAAFSIAPAGPVAAGQAVSFTNLSQQAQLYTWYLNGAPVATTQHYAYTFPVPGWYKVELLAGPAPNDPVCANLQTAWLQIHCSMAPTVQCSHKKTVVGQSIQFSSQVTDITGEPGAISYEWYANDTLINTAPSFSHSFNTPGKKVYCLVTVRGACRDTSNKGIVDVKPLPDYTLNLDHVVCNTANGRSIKFSVCNDGFTAMPAGIPVSFYNANPLTGAAQPLMPVWSTPEAIAPFCCRDFEAALPAGVQVNGVYAVINDDQTKPAPYSFITDFPVTAFHERQYTNNLDSLGLQPFTVAISPRDTAVIIGTGFSVQASGTEPARWQWSSRFGKFLCDTCALTTFTPTQYTRVILNGISAGNCKAADTIWVTVQANGDVFIPSAFTPNNDGNNDWFYILAGKAVRQIKRLQVFNRWGQQVFESRNSQPNIPSLGWNGAIVQKPAPPGAYVYMLVAAFENGQERLYKGTIMLIR